MSSHPNFAMPVMPEDLKEMLKEAGKLHADMKVNMAAEAGLFWKTEEPEPNAEPVVVEGTIDITEMDELL